jgi:PIN domain nuclease of toxin-antitoxin system
MDNEPGRLSATAASLCSDRGNQLVLSVASLWEIQIKLQLGKLSVRLPLVDVVADHVKTNAVEILPVEMAHVMALDGLPPHHRDPFDRLLIAQAMAEGVSLLSADAVFGQYAVHLLT